MNIAIAVCALLLAYLLGSLSGSLMLGRLRGVDIRTLGSGNAGGTNAFRTQGTAFALGTIAIDIGKGALATWLALQAPQPRACACAGSTHCATVKPLDGCSGRNARVLRQCPFSRR